MDLRRLLLPALLLLACDDDDDARFVTLDGGSLDASPRDAVVNPEQDASCTDTMFSDFDGDGFSRANGDCNDCERLVGPTAHDFPGNGVDEDCSGKDATLAELTCDTTVKDDDTDPEDAMRAFGLCSERRGGGSVRPGLVDMKFARLDTSKQGLGDPRQLWLPEQFGVILPREGQRLLALSTGVARDVDARDYTPGCDTFSGEPDTGNSWSGGVPPPKGFPR
ncbi:MAG: hypothetical protein ABW352_05830, partial [Polyangiales bacterium]